MPCRAPRNHIHLPQTLESTLSLHFNNTRHPLQVHFIACKKSILCLFSKSGSSREVPITVSLSLLLWQAEGTQKSSGIGGWFLAMCSAGGECVWKTPEPMWRVAAACSQWGQEQQGHCCPVLDTAWGVPLSGNAAGAMDWMSSTSWDAMTDQNIQQSRSVCLRSLSSDPLIYLLFLHRSFSG